MIALLKALLAAGLISACQSAAIRLASLPTTGFITGRAATADDVAAGNAAFSMQGAARGPLPIGIPQYAYWTDENRRRVPVIVVQAERGPNGEEMVGMRKLDGSEIVATLAEVTLLGTERPR